MHGSFTKILLLNFHDHCFVYHIWYFTLTIEFDERLTLFFYIIINIESTGPYPHPGDCKNRTIFISGRNTIHLKPVRFLKKVGQPVKTKVLRGTCKPKGDVGVGHHFVVCKVTDPQTKISATCSYWLNIQSKYIQITDHF